MIIGHAELGEYEKIIRNKDIANQTTMLEEDKITAIQNLYSYDLPTNNHLNIVSGLSYILKEETVDEVFVRSIEIQPLESYTRAIVDWFNEYIVSNYSRGS